MSDLLETVAETAADAVVSGKGSNKDPEKPVSFWSDLLPFLLVALAIVIPVRLFVIQPFIVSGASMVPTFDHGHYLIVDELTYRTRDPGRGEVVIFRFPEDEKKFFIKRIIGTPGETVEIEQGKVFVTPVGGERFHLDEDYARLGSVRYLKATLAETEYFVMGDNRPQSSDSRSWGPVVDDLIIGRPILRLFPLSQMGFFPGALEVELEVEDET